MKALRNLSPEKRNALVFLLIFLLGTIATLLSLRFQTSYVTYVTKLWEQMHGETGRRHEISFSPDGEFLITAAKTVKVWRAKDGQLVKSFPFNTRAAVKTLAPNGKWLATYDVNGTVKVWKLPEGKIVRWFKFDGEWPPRVAFSPDGEFLAAASDRLGVVKVWRVESGELVKSLSLGDEIMNLAVSPGGEFLAVMTLSSIPNRLELWHLPSAKKISVIRAPFTTIDKFSFSPDGKFLTAGKVYSGVALWKVGSEKSQRWEISSQNYVMMVRFHPRDSSLLLVYEDTSRDLLAPLRSYLSTNLFFWVYDDVLSCWRLTEGGLKKLWEVRNIVNKPLVSTEEPVSALAFSPDGKLMAVVTAGSRVKVFRLDEKLFEGPKGAPAR